MNDTKGANIINWKINAQGVMTIEGKGKIPDCNKSVSAEWHDVKDDIKEIYISEGITEIGLRSFELCINLEKIHLPRSLYRIHAYAFNGCRKLVVLETERKDIKYIFDSHKYNVKDTLIFGIDSFFGTPWSKIKFGDFYINSGQLFAVFNDEKKDLAVPEGVRVLKSFSLNNLDLDSLILPESLKMIEDFAFCGTRIGNKLQIQDLVKSIPEYAFANCCIKWKSNTILNPDLIDEKKENQTKRRETLLNESKCLFGDVESFEITKKLNQSIIKSCLSEDAIVIIIKADDDNYVCAETWKKNYMCDMGYGYWDNLWNDTYYHFDLVDISKSKDVYDFTDDMNKQQKIELLHQQLRNGNWDLNWSGDGLSESEIDTVTLARYIREIVNRDCENIGDRRAVKVYITYGDSEDMYYWTKKVVKEFLLSNSEYYVGLTFR